YRKMAEDTVNKAIKVGSLDNKHCRTYNLRIEDTKGDLNPGESYSTEPMHSVYQISEMDIVKAARFEMARTVEDVLARRFRILFLDAQAAFELAPQVVPILAKELNKDEEWQKNQLLEFSALVKPYLIEYFIKPQHAYEKTN